MSALLHSWVCDAWCIPLWTFYQLTHSHSQERLLRQLCDVRRVLGDVPGAAAAGQDLLKACEQRHGPASLPVASALRALASVYRTSSDMRPLAKPLLLRAMGILTRHLGGDHEKVAAALTSLAVLSMRCVAKVCVCGCACALATPTLQLLTRACTHTGRGKARRQLATTRRPWRCEADYSQRARDLQAMALMMMMVAVTVVVEEARRGPPKEVTVAARGMQGLLTLRRRRGKC